MASEITEAMLNEAMTKAVEMELELRKKKKESDRDFNRLIGLEQKKQLAILEEIDMIRSGIQEGLPFTDTDWTRKAADRRENV